MILISNGLPKSGTSLTFLYSLFLFREHFGSNAINARSKIASLVESGTLQGHAKLFISSFEKDALHILSEVERDFGPVLVKTHAAPNVHLLEAIKNRRIHMTFVDRDPRDIILSAIDYHHRTKNTSSPQMIEFSSIRDSIKPLKRLLLTACQWVGSGVVHRVQYHKLLTSPREVIAGISEYLEIPKDDALIERVIERELNQRKIGAWQFNRGQLTRFQNEMSDEELELCNHELGEFIELLGYE